jgi:hypothetical protein
MVILLIDNDRNALVRYVNGVAVERFNITDRCQFDRSFTPADAERMRQGAWDTAPQ